MKPCIQSIHSLRAVCDFKFDTKVITRKKKNIYMIKYFIFIYMYVYNFKNRKSNIIIDSLSVRFMPIPSR